MNTCGCKWDGNLDGRLVRCATHAALLKKEKKARKEANALFKRLMETE